MADEDRIYVTRTKPVLSREQKTAFGFVLGFGALALVFGSFYLWKHVASPFVLTYTGPKFLTGDEQQQQEMDRLKGEDTDDDGLDDYSELYVYRTSPYLKDSDSDGADDKTEVMNGDDPNCSPTMPCASVAADTVNPTDLRGSFAEDLAKETAGSVAGGAPSAEPVDIVATLAAMSTDQIRALLIEAGGDPTTINALTDDQLRSALAQALGDLQSSTTSVESDTSTTTTTETSTTEPTSSNPSP
ncbi:MAG: hypothetical protein AAB839_00770 [Patescibacteria group bacterium]